MPVAEIVPTVGLSVHVTALLEVPPTIAAYCWVWAAARVAESGVSEIVTGGVSVTVALADLVGSARLVAFTLTVWELVIEAGAVYRPAVLMLPTSGLSAQVTAVLPVLVTVAENVWV